MAGYVRVNVVEVNSSLIMSVRAFFGVLLRDLTPRFAAFRAALERFEKP